MFRIDHHIHTTLHSPDSVMEPRELVHRATEVGLDAVVITEHDRLWNERELRALQADAGKLVVLAGVEVSAIEGHFLVYGLKNLDDVYAGITLERLVPVVRAAGGAIVAAHPFRWGQAFDEIVAAHDGALDGVELVSNNVTHETRALTERLLEDHPFPTTGSSDGHAAEVVGCYFTEFPEPIRTIEQFAQAIRGGRGRPGHRVGARLTCGPVGGRGVKPATAEVGR